MRDLGGLERPWGIFGDLEGANLGDPKECAVASTTFKNPTVPNPTVARPTVASSRCN